MGGVISDGGGKYQNDKNINKISANSEEVEKNPESILQGKSKEGKRKTENITSLTSRKEQLSSIHNIEIFLRESYQKCSLDEILRSILGNKSGRMHVQQFILANRDASAQNTEDVIKMFDYFFNDYFDIPNKFELDLNLDYSSFQNQMHTIISEFIKSKHYDNWRKSELDSINTEFQVDRNIQKSAPKHNISKMISGALEGIASPKLISNRPSMSGLLSPKGSMPLEWIFSPKDTAINMRDRIPYISSKIQPEQPNDIFNNDENLLIQDLSRHSSLNDIEETKKSEEKTSEIKEKSSSYIDRPDIIQGCTVNDVKAITDKEELKKIFTRDTWLFTLLCIMENAPFSFSISTADNTRLGFPLIYVNKHIEYTMGYIRSEIIGKNASMFQRDKSGELLWQLPCYDMSSALEEGKCYACTLKNFRKNGESFEKFIYLKPIFDMLGVYAYVVSVQFEVTDEGNLETAKDLAGGLMKHILGWIGENSEMNIS